MSACHSLVQGITYCTFEVSGCSRVNETIPEWILWVALSDNGALHADVIRPVVHTVIVCTTAAAFRNSCWCFVLWVFGKIYYGLVRDMITDITVKLLFMFLEIFCELQSNFIIYTPVPLTCSLPTLLPVFCILVTDGVIVHVWLPQTRDPVAVQGCACSVIGRSLLLSAGRPGTLWWLHTLVSFSLLAVGGGVQLCPPDEVIRGFFFR